MRSDALCRSFEINLIIKSFEQTQTYCYSYSNPHIQLQLNNIKGTLCQWGPIETGTVCPWGLIETGTFCPLGPLRKGPFGKGD